MAKLEPPADRHYGFMRVHLERAGTPISANDMFIAAHALATDSVLVTDNVKEFLPRAGAEDRELVAVMELPFSFLRITTMDGL